MHRRQICVLQIGEIQCVDRCAGKYLAAQDAITKTVEEFNVKQQELAAAGGNNGKPRLGGGPPKF